MFDIGFWEILLILVLALVVIGPERLPGAARKAGYFIGKARRYIEGVRSEVESELDVSEFKRMLHNQEIQINELKQQLQDGADKVGRDVSQDIKRPQPDSDILTDVPAHSFYDTEQPASAQQPADGSADSPSATSSMPEEDTGDKASSASEPDKPR